MDDDVSISNLSLHSIPDTATVVDYDLPPPLTTTAEWFTIADEHLGFQEKLNVAQQTSLADFVDSIVGNMTKMICHLSGAKSVTSKRTKAIKTTKVTTHKFDALVKDQWNMLNDMVAQHVANKDPTYISQTDKAAVVAKKFLKIFQTNMEGLDDHPLAPALKEISEDDSLCTEFFVTACKLYRENNKAAKK